MSASQVKKLSVSAVYGKIKLAALMKTDTDGAPVPVHCMDVFGVAAKRETGSKEMAGEQRTWTALKGTFEARNPETGETFASATLYLPDVALLPLLLAMDASANGVVDFAISVFATLNEDSPVKYEYSWKPLLPPSESDPLERVRQRLLALPSASAAPALAAPAGDQSDAKSESGEGINTAKREATKPATKKAAK